MLMPALVINRQDDPKVIDQRFVVIALSTHAKFTAFAPRRDDQLLLRQGNATVRGSSRAHLSASKRRIRRRLQILAHRCEIRQPPRRELKGISQLPIARRLASLLSEITRAFLS